jgi:hypothetical protein
MGKKILAGILGGLAFFAWSSIAHTMLPLGKTGVKEVPGGEVTVLAAMKAGIPEEGLYLLPGLGVVANPTREQESAAMQQRMQKVATGQSAFLVYHPAGVPPFPRMLVKELVTNMVQIFLAVLLLGQTSLSSFGARWRFITIAGILAAISTNISYWIFYGFPGNYTLAAICTIAMGFVVGGLVAAALVKPEAKSMAAAR